MRGDTPQASDVVAITGAAKPFDSLAGVRVGMRASELLERRPGVQVAGYYGYGERIGEHSVGYRIPGSYSEHQAPPASARLEGVVASRELPDSSNAAAAWRAAVAEQAAALGQPADCFTLAWPVGEAWLAVWRREGSDLYLVGQPAFGGSPPTRATLRLGVTKRGEYQRDVGGTGTARPC